MNRAINYNLAERRLQKLLGLREKLPVGTFLLNVNTNQCFTRNCTKACWGEASTVTSRLNSPSE